MKNKSTLFLVQAAAIGAVYVVVTLLFAPLSFGEVQIRFAEALTILPYFTPAAIPGYLWAVSSPTSWAVRSPLTFCSEALPHCWARSSPTSSAATAFLAPVPPIVANTLIVPFVLHYGYGINLPIPFMMLTVGVGEVVSCAVLGMILLTALSKYGNMIFGRQTAR